MRVLLDSNVYVSAYATHGLCEMILDACLRSHSVQASETLLGEVAETLREKIGLPAPTVAEILAFLRGHVALGTPSPVGTGACRDPDDLHVLGLALAAHAEAIVTGDQDLLVLKSFRGIPIFSPREFWQRWGG